jgi:hypothetical protein
MPALFIMLQVALVLHHHRTEESCYDDNDSLHSAPEAFYPDHIKQDVLICVASRILLPTLPGLWFLIPDSPKTPVTILAAAPPQSRAPPGNTVSLTFKYCSKIYGASQVSVDSFVS